MKKKILSIITIITMLLLPFSMLLTVHATVQTANGIHYDDATTKVGDSSSFLTTDTANIVVSDVNTGDSFKAYKVLDIYYNPTINQISYQFTGDANSPKTDFAKFINTLTTADIEDITGIQNKSTFTVEDYLNLTSDNGTTGGNNTSSNSVSTSSTLNKLVSKYATYIRTNAGTANAVSGTTMTSGTGTATLANAVSGAYLILPESLGIAESTEQLFNKLLISTYGALVANVLYAPGSNNAWTLPECSIKSKFSENVLNGVIMPARYSDLMNITDPAEQAAIVSHTGTSTNLDSGGVVSYITPFPHLQDLPENTHTSISGNQAITNLLTYYEVTIPSGFSFDLSDAMDIEGYEFEKRGNNYYDGEDMVVEPLSTTKVRIHNVDHADGVIASIVADNSYTNFTAGDANTITVKQYYIKDPYIDIGSNVTLAEVEAALDPDLQNPTARQQAIQKAIGTFTQELSVYIYGLKINNKNTSNTNLSGGVFQTYNDPSCAAGTEIGPTFTVTNGVGSFVGISGYKKVYIKQITAPTGYKLYDKIIDATPVTEEQGQGQGQSLNRKGVIAKKLEAPAGHVERDAVLQGDNYYTISTAVVNEQEGFLPFTGGVGTIIFTCVGLIIVLAAILFILAYKKKNKKEDEKK